MDSDRTLTQKIILWALLAMAVVFTAINIILKFFPGVEFEDTLLKVEHWHYSGSKDGTDIQIYRIPEGGGDGFHEYTVELRTASPDGSRHYHQYKVILWDDGILTEFGEQYIRTDIYCDGILTFSGGYEIASRRFCDLEGELLLFETDASVPGESLGLSRSEVLRFAIGQLETTTRGSWLHYGMALFFSIICAVAVAFPYTLFELRYHWSVKDPEPTDFYLRMNELCGGIVTVVLLIVYIVGVTKIV